jgi:hypothetical protein
MGIKSGEGTVVVKQVFAEIRAQNAPVLTVVYTVGLAAIYKGYINGAVYGKIVSAF